MGYTPQYLTAHPFLWRDSIHPDDFPQVAEAVQDDSLNQGGGIEYRIKDAKGNWVWFEDRFISKFKDGDEILVEGLAADISKRKQAEQALQELNKKLKQSNEELKQLYHSVDESLDGFDIVDDQGLLTYANKAYLKMWGYDKLDEVLGTSPASHCADPKMPEKIITQVNKKSCGDFEFTARRKDGSFFEVFMRVSAHQDESGKRLYHGFSQDITERKQIERALRESEAQFRALTEYSPDIIARFDRDLRHLYINPKGLEISGLALEDFIGKSNEELGMSADAVSLWHEHMKRVFDTGGTEKLEFSFQTAGKLHYFQSLIVPELQDNGTVQTVIGVSRDVTEYVQAKKTAQERLSHLQAILESTDNIVCSRDTEHSLLYFNKAFATIVEKLFNAKASTGMKTIELMPKEERRHWQPILEKVLSGKTCREEFDWTFGDNEMHHYASVYNPIEQEGEIIGYAEFTSDVTEDKNKEKELHQAKENAEAASHAKSAFLASMSHELRTPLNAVLGYAQLLQMDATLNDKQRQYLSHIASSGDHLLSLISDILDLAKIESDRLELCVESRALEDIFSELSHVFDLRCGQKLINFQYICKTSLPTVETDERRLRQIFMNLLSNAVKFTQQGEIRFEVDYRDNTLFAQVNDTGVGISREMQEKIFQPFTQTGEDVYRQQGAGLGLAITRHLVEEMKGRIELHSELGKGSCFALAIPMPKQEGTVHIAPGDKHIISTVTGYRRLDNIDAALRVLVADDNEANRMFLASFLEPLGFDVSQTVDGTDTLALTETQNFDLILMDIIMPKLDGLETTRQILARPKENNRTIVAVSACAYDEDHQESLKAGCLDYISKPVDCSRLLQILQRLLPLEWVY